MLNSPILLFLTSLNISDNYNLKSVDMNGNPQTVDIKRTPGANTEILFGYPANVPPPTTNVPKK